MEVSYLRRTMFWALLLVTLAGCNSNQQPDQLPVTSDQASVWSEVQNDIEPYSGLQHVVMLNDHAAWVAGQPTSLNKVPGWVKRLELVDGKWQTTSTQQFSEGVAGMAATSDNNVWLLTGQNQLNHKDNDGWHSSDLPVTDIIPTALQLSADGQTAWVAGEVLVRQSNCCSRYPSLLRYEAGSWHEEQGINGSSGITNLSIMADDGWAVLGTNSGRQEPAQPALYRYQQGKWSLWPDTACPNGILCHAALNDIKVVAPGEAWAVGYYQSDPNRYIDLRPYLLHFKDNKWQEVLPATLLGTLPNQQASRTYYNVLAFTDPQHGLLVGGQCNLPNRPIDCIDYPLVLRYNGQQWQAETGLLHKRGTGSMGVNLWRVSMDDAGQGLAIDSSMGLLYGSSTQTATGTPVALLPIIPGPTTTRTLPYPPDSPGAQARKLLKQAFANMDKLSSYHINLGDTYGANPISEADLAFFAGKRYIRRTGEPWTRVDDGGYIIYFGANSTYQSVLSNATSPDPVLLDSSLEGSTTVSHYELKEGLGQTCHFWVGNEANGPLIHKLDIDYKDDGDNGGISYSDFNRYTDLGQLEPLRVFPSPTPEPTYAEGDDQ